MRRIENFYKEHQAFTLLFLLFSAFRLLTVLFLRPGGYIGDYSDFNTSFLPFAKWSDLGLYPYRDYWMEWPPLFPWLVVAVYRLSLLIPSWMDPRLWYNALLGLALLPFEMGNLILIYLVALTLYDQPKAFKCALIYALLFAPLFVASGWIDPMPLFFLLLGLYLLLRWRSASAGLSLGIGFMVKTIPALLLPLGLRILDTKGRLRLLLAFIFVVGAISLPFLLMNPEMFLASFRSMLERSSWETIWAVLEGYYSFGALGGDRFDPHADVSIHPSTLPWPLITLGFGLVYLWLLTRPLAFKETRRIVAFAGLTVNLFTLYNRGYSPQFIVYLIPFVVLLMPNLRGVLYIILLDILDFLEAWVYFIVLPQERWLLAGTVVWRAVILLALSWEYMALFFSLSRERYNSFARRAFALLVIAALICAAFAGYFTAQAYGEIRYAQEEYHPLVEFLKNTANPGSILLLPEENSFQRLYPYLWNRMALYVARDIITSRLEEQPDIWLLLRPGDDETMRERLASEMRLVGTYDFNQTSLWHFER